MRPNPLTPKRNGRENLLRFILVALGEAWLMFLAGLLLGVVSVSGCTEIVVYLRQHGY